MIVAVLRDQLWVYPAMIILNDAFVAYQLCRIVLDLTLLTIFDALVYGSPGANTRPRDLTTIARPIEVAGRVQVMACCRRSSRLFTGASAAS